MAGIIDLSSSEDDFDDAEYNTWLVEQSFLEENDHRIDTPLPSTSRTNGDLVPSTVMAADTEGFDPSKSTQNDLVAPPNVSHITDRRDTLMSLFPDADPDFLHEVVVSYEGDDDGLQAWVNHTIAVKGYPLLKDRLKRDNEEKIARDHMNRNFTPEEILEWNFNPLTYFYDKKRTVSARYVELTRQELVKRFPKIRDPYLRRLLYEERSLFLPCLRALEKLDWTVTSKHCRKTASKTRSIPLEPDESFYRELAFSRVEQSFRSYLKNKEEEKEKRIALARVTNSLVTCNCCFDDEILEEDAVFCEYWLHRFCHECVRRGMEVAIGQTKTELQCMAEECEAKFTMDVLKAVLSTNVYTGLVRQIEAAEIEMAQIPDLEKCPHCPFAAIMPDKNDKVFRCLNADCLKETCRLCKEPSHIPLRCDEMESQSEVRMRTYIENKMSEALMRECPSCHRRFTKDFGCNMMRCICGTNMCYVCRQAIKDYTHFGPQKCPQESDLEQLHNTDVMMGAQKAKQDFVDRNPDAKDLDLKHDPFKDLPAVRPAVPIPAVPPQPAAHPNNIQPAAHQNNNQQAMGNYMYFNPANFAGFREQVHPIVQGILGPYFGGNRPNAGPPVMQNRPAEAALGHPPHVQQGAIAQPAQRAAVDQAHQHDTIAQAFRRAAVAHVVRRVAAARLARHATVAQAGQRAAVAQPVQQAAVARPVQQTTVAQLDHRALVPYSIRREAVAQSVQHATVPHSVRRTKVVHAVQCAAVAQPVQRAAVAQPVQRAMVAQPVQHAAVAQPVQRAVVAQPVQQATVDQPVRRTTGAHPAPSATVHCVVLQNPPAASDGRLLHQPLPFGPAAAPVPPDVQNRHRIGPQRITTTPVEVPLAAAPRATRLNPQAPVHHPFARRPVMAAAGLHPRQ